MASMASDLNCISVVGVEDFYRRLRPAADDASALRLGKVFVAACGVLTIGLATRLAHSQSGVLSLYYTITAIVAGGLAGLFLLAFLVRSANRTGAIAGIFANLLFTIWATLTLGGKTVDLGRFNFPWHDYMIGAIGHVILFCVGYLVSVLTPADVPVASDLTWLGWRARQRILAFKSTTTTI